MVDSRQQSSPVDDVSDVLSIPTDDLTGFGATAC